MKRGIRRGLACVAGLGASLLGMATARAESADAPSEPTVRVGENVGQTRPQTEEEKRRANFREKGRIGILGAITEDNWKGGLIFEHEYFEVQLLAHAAFSSGDTRDVDTVGKAGLRLGLGTLNYLAIGGEFRTRAGSREAGVSVGGAYGVGPYLSLERYFAATPVMLNLWVNPFRYDHDQSAGPSGTAVGSNSVRVFQTGGFGLAYLF